MCWSVLVAGRRVVAGALNASVWPVGDCTTARGSMILAGAGAGGTEVADVAESPVGNCTTVRGSMTLAGAGVGGNVVADAVDASVSSVNDCTTVGGSMILGVAGSGLRLSRADGRDFVAVANAGVGGTAVMSVIEKP